MAFIQTISPRKATGETAEVYQDLARFGGLGLVPQIVRLFSLRPGSMRMMIRKWELTMWGGKEPRQTREMLAAAVSRFNNCHYWIDAHEAFLQAAGGQATRVVRLIEGVAKDATPLENALIALVRKASEQPARLAPSDLAPIREIVDAGALDYALVVAVFHFVNRMADLLHADSEVLPQSLRRIDFLRRLMVRFAGFFMAKMDLSTRNDSTSYEEALANLARHYEPAPGRAPTGDFASLKSRPKLIEVFRLALEERDLRSSLDRATLTRIHKAVEAALPGNLDEAERKQALSEDPVEAFAFGGTRHAYRTTESLIDALRQEGYDDLGVLDLAIAVAEANQWARIHRLVGLKPELFYVGLDLSGFKAATP